MESRPSKIVLAAFLGWILLISACTNHENQVIKVSPNFAADAREVSVEEFRAFIAETHYKTTADSLGWSGYFDTTKGKWGIAVKANWEKSDGVNINPPNWPVTQVSFYDACAYCEWKNGRLPTSAEWDGLALHLISRGNIWQGVFPLKDRGEDGHKGLAPVGSFKSNQKGFYDLTGNVWEWTSTRATAEDRFMLNQANALNARIIKGGSFLCVEGGCEGFKAKAYQITEANSGTNHLGFRCVYDLND